MELFTNTLFINLEHRKDRLQHIRQEFEKMVMQGERFNAVKTKVGAIGCTMSHIKCLEIAKERNYPYVFICEDDIMFLNPDILKDSLQKFYDNTTIDWDVLLIGGNNVPPYEKIGDYCIRVSNCQTTTGYVVKRHYYDTLILNFRDSVKNLIREPTNHREYALDIYWKRLQTSGRWYMLIPFTVVQADGYSDIENRAVDYRGLMLDMDKEWLFRGTYGSPGRPLP
jgi:GR25 family glycosyltransferase involved in LPS biosynthesis